MSAAFNMLDALEAPAKETLHPAIYVEPRDKSPESEDSRQATFVATMRRLYKACEVYAVPNGGKRSQWAAAKAKREGMRKGWPDVGVLWADAREARVEFKNGSKMPDEDQIEVLNWMHLRGHPVAVCRTAEGAIAWLRSVGAPVGAIR
jgi:hypothetical protein